MPRFLPVLCALALACGGSKPPRKLVLLHTNDEHSHLLGSGPEADDFARTHLAAVPAAGADTLTVSAGDDMMGTLMQIAAAKASAEGMPQIVASNIHFSGTAGDAALQALFDETGTDASRPIHRKLLVVTPNGLRVGFVGIMGADPAAVAPPKAPTTFSIAQGTTDDNRLAPLAQIFTDLQPFVDSLRRDGKADLVVALSHSGADVTSPDESEDFAIARGVSGIDVIVSGHAHTEAPATLIVNERNGSRSWCSRRGGSATTWGGSRSASAKGAG